MDLAALDQYVSAALSITAGLIVFAHGLEWVAKRTANQTDDAVAAGLLRALNAVLAFLPRLRFGGPKLLPLALGFYLAAFLPACGTLSTVHDHAPAAADAAQGVLDVVCKPVPVNAQFCADGYKVIDDVRAGIVGVDALLPLLKQVQELTAAASDVDAGV
jgi:hypothetical protein